MNFNKKPPMQIENGPEGKCALRYWLPSWAERITVFASRADLDAFMMRSFGPIQGGLMRRCEGST